YQPSSSRAEEVLRFAQSMAEKHRSRLRLLALAVTDEKPRVLRQHAELQLTFPILAGSGLLHSYVQDETPKLIWVDRDGIVRKIYVGWGSEASSLIGDDLERLLQPT